LIAAFIFLVVFGIRAVKGDIDFEFYADSETYMELWEENFSFFTLLLLNPNVAGMILIIDVFSGNYILIFLLNCLIAWSFYEKSTNYLGVDKNAFLVFLLLSPMFFSSVLTINKEIIALGSIGFFIGYLDKRNFAFLLMSIILAGFVRWQMVLFILTAYGCFQLSWKIGRRYLILGVLLASISGLYFHFLPLFEFVNNVSKLDNDHIKSGGTFVRILAIQNSSYVGYFLVFFPKFIFLSLSLLSRIKYFGDPENFYNYGIVLSQTIINLFIFMRLVMKKVTIKNDYLFLAAIYLIIFCLSPIFAPRYLFPAFILLALAITSQNVTE
jgi:hypothetical protein